MKRLLCLYCVIWLAGCATAPTHHILSDVEGVNKNLILPREFVAKMNKTGGYNISPDGTKMIYWQRSLMIPYLSPTPIYIKNFATGDVQKYPDLSKARGIYWSGDSNTIIYNTSLKHNGKYYNQLIARDITTTKPNKTLLVPLLSQQGRMYFHKSIKGSAAEIVVGLKSKDPKQYFHAPTYYLVDYTTGQYTELAAASPHLRDWIISDKGDVLGSYRTNISGFDVQWHVDTEDQTLFSCDNDSEINYVTNDIQFIYFLSNCLSDKVAINQVDKQSYKIETLHELEDVDIDSIVADKLSNRLLFATANNRSTEFIAFDKRFAFLQDWHKDQLSKTIVVLNGSDNGNKFILGSSDLSGWQQWLVDTSTQQITPLEKHILPGKQSRVGSYQAIEIPSDNGIPVQAFLARPNFIAPDIKIPTVIYLHGGPTARSYPGYNPEISFLTNRGYAVLVVNYHGSTGYGKDYMRLPYGNFTSLPNSVSAAVDWLIDSGSVDPAKIALMGGSYGGYLSLLMPSLDSRFACSVVVNASSDVSKMVVQDKDNFGETEFVRYFSRSHYHGNGSMADYDTWSPIGLNYTDYKILLVHAEGDRRVPIEQSTEFYKKFKSTNSIRFVTLANESHRLQRWTSRLRILRESEKFLAQCLGGPKGGFDYYSIVEPLSRIYYLF